MAIILNEYFASVFTDENNSSNLSTPRMYNNNTYLNTCVFHENDILNAINILKTNKTIGPDQIPPRILKEAKNELVKPLCIIFNKSISTAKVPRDWNLANVTSTFKKGNKSHPGNYRPISLTLIVSKLMESIFRDKIGYYLEKNKIIKDSQHCFRNERSCFTHDFFNEVYSLYDNTKAVDIIYLDFQKAFDKVPHKRLLSKVKAHDITKNFSTWIKDWLSERKQRVVIKRKTS